MRLLHTSDWHLGMTFRGGITFNADQRFVIGKICDIAVEEKVDGILLAGDVFDRSVASAEALRAYDEIITHICADLGIPVYLIAGNHDGAERLAPCSELLKKSGLYISSVIKKTPQVVNAGDVDIYLLPWFSTDKVKSIFPEYEEEINTMEDAYKVVLDSYRACFIPGHKNILVAHSYIVDAETSTSDHAAEVGTATMVGSYVFDGFDYVALGHLHGPQQINEHIRYSGTPMAYSFGKEEKQEKSVTIIDTDNLEAGPKIIPIPQLHKRTTLTGTFDELMAADFAEDIVNGYVRLVVTDKYVGLDSMASFRERYPNLLEMTGKSMEYEDAKITMTIDELQDADQSPEKIFERYCTDIMNEAPSSHLKDLFTAAMNEYAKEVSEE